MLGKAIYIASAAFEDKKDKGGEPYILHCIEVMNNVSIKEDKYKIVAVLHDILEDSDWTDNMLLNQGFNAEIVNAIVCLTHVKGETYNDYILRVSGDKIATIVKLSDLVHNSNILRLKEIENIDLARIAKYHRSYVYLRSVYNMVHK